MCVKWFAQEVFMQRHLVLIALLVSSTLRASSDVSGERQPRRVLAELMQPAASSHVSIDTGMPSPVTMAPNGRGQPAGDSQPGAGSSRIRGRVLIGDTMLPVRRATIQLTSPDLREPRAATTDLEGRYELANLPPGRYSISASKNGFLGLSYGQTRPSMPAQTLQLRARQVVDGVDLVLFRGGAISGRVLDEFGDPLTNVLVTVLRSQFQQGKPRLIADGARADTNDLGEYRIFALPPGSYYVSATLPPNPPPVDENGVQLLGDDPGGLAPIFYPATTDPTTAAKVNVTAGHTVPEVNMTLVATRLARVSGVATDRQGGPMTAGSVNAIPRGMAQNGFARSAPLRLDGQFRLTGLPPGEYTLLASSSSRVVPPAPGLSPAAPPRADVATGIVAVNGNDVDGVRLAPLVPVTVRGRVIFDNPVSATKINASAVRVTGEALNPDDAMAGLIGPPTTPRADFRFVLQLPPMLVIPRATVGAGSGTSWTVKAVSVNGLDVTDTGIALRPGEDVSGVEIELTDRPSEVLGTVTVRNAPASGYNVIVFPQDRDRWTLSGPSVFQSIRTDASGRFSMTGFRPGRFYAVAVLELDDLGWNDPEFLESAAQRATAFTLAHGEQKLLDLRGRSQ
jgi:hypothetical protein